MAEPDTTTAPQVDYQQLYQQLMAQPPAPTGARAQVARPSSITGLLGSALGGGPSGAVPVSADEADASGNRALLNFGLNLLANSGYRTDRPTIGQLIGGGIGAAQQSLGQSEALTAARGQAQQEYAQSQQEMKIARIKEALPILTLIQDQQRAAAARALSGQGNTDISAAGDVPFALNNPLNIRFAGQPGAVNTNGFAAWKTPEEGQAATDALFGKYAEGGINTLSGLISRWAPPGENDTPGYIAAVAKATGIDPNAKIDIRDPAVRAKVQAAMAVQEGNKNSRRPAAPVAADAPPARQPIPATDASGGSTAEAAPSPGRAQFAGPGVPPDAVAPPPSPGAAGNADAIAQGMIARGADPDTLAPTGRGVSADEVTTAAAGPAVPPAPDVPKPPAYPDITVGNLMIRHPGEFNDYYKQQYVPPPKTEDFNPDLTPAQKAAFAERQAGLNRERQKIGLTLPDKNQPEALRGLDKEQTALNTDVQNMIQAKRAAADAKLTTYDDAQQKAIQTRYDLATQAYNKAFDQAQQGDIVSRQSRETSDLASRKTIIDQLGKEAVESRGAVSELDGLLALSNNVKNPSVFATLKIGDTTILNRMAQLGIVDKGEAGATQLLQSGISNAIARLRQGMSMGNLSDRDLNFIENMAPNVYENPQTRAAVISYLRRAQDQKMRYNLEVNKLTADGKPISEALKTAAETIETKYPIVPLRSQELADHWLDPDPVWKAKRQDWAEEHNIRPGTMFRKPNGGLEIVYSPGMAPVKAPVAIEVGGNR